MVAEPLQSGSDPDRTLNKKVIHKRGRIHWQELLKYEKNPPLISHSETVLQILHQNKEEAALVYGQTLRYI